MLTKLSSDKLVLVDSNGLPRYWSAVWSLFNGSHLAMNTLTTKLGHIDALYLHAESMGLNLDDALADLNAERLGSVLEAFFVQLRNVQRQTIFLERRWQTAFQFVQDTCSRLERVQTIKRKMPAVQAEIKRLNNLFLGLHPFRPRFGRKPKSIPRIVIEELLQVAQPGDQKNPFQAPSTQWRAYALVCLLLLQGLRVGEALSLKADFLQSERDYRSGALRHRMSVETNEQEDDPRAQRPSLKNEYSVRTIPVTEITAGAFLAYIENYRGKVNHGFFLSSARKQPISLSGVAKLLEQLTEVLSSEARLQLLNVTGATYIRPHALRHTCAVVRMKQLLLNGVSVDQAMMHMRSFFGWSKESVMPQHYAKAAIDERLNETWGENMDKHIEILRSIPL